MPIACRICIMVKGLSGEEIVYLSKTEEELAQHIEHAHHIPVRREGETEEQCAERFKRANPEAGGPNCKCPLCTGTRISAFRAGGNHQWTGWQSTSRN